MIVLFEPGCSCYSSNVDLIQVKLKSLYKLRVLGIFFNLFAGSELMPSLEDRFKEKYMFPLSPQMLENYRRQQRLGSL